MAFKQQNAPDFASSFRAHRSSVGVRTSQIDDVGANSYWNRAFDRSFASVFSCPDPAHHPVLSPSAQGRGLLQLDYTPSQTSTIALG